MFSFQKKKANVNAKMVELNEIDPINNEDDFDFDFETVQARSKGFKRAKLTHAEVNDSLNPSGDSVAVLKDDLTVFGEFIVSEMRKMKSETRRRELKRLVMNYLFDVAEEDE